MNKNQTSLAVNNLTKFYSGIAGSKIHVLDELSFLINTGNENIISILAPFGAGKSTLLKIICGIEEPDSGEILLNKKKYSSCDSDIILIPEEPSSFPWLNVEQNINLALNLTNKNEYKINDLVSFAGLAGYEDHFPNNKSLGFRFRISLARALAVNPKIILLDDPFKKVDPETRKELYDVIKLISEKLNVIFILATTNISEAIYLSERIFMMKKNPGKIFNEMKLEKNKNDIKDETFFSIRKEIESSFKLEKVINDASFSI